MIDPMDQSEIHNTITRALRDDEAVWTPNCVDPDELVSLLKQGTRLPRAASLLDHIADCAYCRQVFAETRDALRLARELRQADAQREPKGDTSAAYPPRRGLPWTLGMLSPHRVGLAFGTATMIIVAGALGYWWAALAGHGRIARLEQSAQTNLAGRRMAEHENADLHRQLAADATLKTKIAAIQQDNRLAMVAVKDLIPAQNARLDTLLTELGVPLEKPRGDGTHTPGVNLIEPVAQVIIEQSPTFRWDRVSGADHYDLFLAKKATDGRDHDLTPQFIHMKTTQWTWQGRSLERGQKYEWNVVARDRSNNLLAQSRAAFRVLDAQTVQALAEADRDIPLAHWKRGLLYWQAGVLDKAEQEFKAFVAQEPHSAVAAALLHNIQTLRHSKGSHPQQ